MGAFTEVAKASLDDLYYSLFIRPSQDHTVLNLRSPTYTYSPHSTTQLPSIQTNNRRLRQILLIPALTASALYVLLAYLILPLLRKHRARYNQYLPLETLSSTSTTLRDRFSNFLTRLARPPGRVVDGGGGWENGEGDFEAFGDEEGESMVGFDFRRQEREVRGGRVESLWSDGRLSRDLEEGFRDDSEDDEEDNRRRGRQ